MDFEARYEFTYPLYMEANQLFRKKNIRTAIFYGLIWFVLPISCLLLAAILAAVRMNDPSENPPDYFAILMPLGYAIFLWGLRWYCFRRAYRNIFPGKVTRRDCFLVFSDAGVHTEIAGVASSEWTWQAFCRVVSNDKLALVLFTKTKFLCIPRENLTPTDWDQFVVFLQSKVASTKC
ncbi:hypothetical protein [Terriglobus albidus]|uniref:hypothetical protein n=1 Tax=Terriglobus albidus TaxID=1592106 RepID=UPI0021DF5803|nr:hypothetical protein [Terriglobus albidus]